MLSSSQYIFSLGVFHCDRARTAWQSFSLNWLWVKANWCMFYRCSVEAIPCDEMEMRDTVFVTNIIYMQWRNTALQRSKVCQGIKLVYATLSIRKLARNMTVKLFSVVNKLLLNPSSALVSEEIILAWLRNNIKNRKNKCHGGSAYRWNSDASSLHHTSGQVT